MTISHFVSRYSITRCFTCGTMSLVVVDTAQPKRSAMLSLSSGFGQVLETSLATDYSYQS